MGPYPESEVQGLLLSSYRRWRFATYLFFRLQTSDKKSVCRWLARMVARTTFGEASYEKRRDAKLNIAITATGLSALGVSDAALETFAPAFREGMTSERRKRILGDDDESAPPWNWGQGEQHVDFVLLLFHKTEAGHSEQVDAELREAESADLRLVYRVPLQALPSSKTEMHEPFGFADGISQPVFDGLTDAEGIGEETARLHRVEVGEFILGYKNAYGEETSIPRLSDSRDADPFGKNGSYLVLRQLQQDIAGFWNYFRAEASRSKGALEVERLAAKAMGRWRNGSPISEYPDGPGPHHADAPRENDFSFARVDPRGDRCPLGAHIRRANPRDSFPGERETILEQVNHHRLLRRGRAYGERIEDATHFADDHGERGLMFACLNGNIERQFEFVHHSWCNNPNFHDLQGEVDPVIGSQPSGGGSHSLQHWPLRQKLSGIQRFITVRGGAYFFLPGRAGLIQLASLHQA